MKLQRTSILAPVPIDYFYRPASGETKHCHLLLHGFDDRPHRLWRMLEPQIAAEGAVLAPCAPYPIPHKQEDKLKLRFSWYFYNVFEKTYHIDQTFAATILNGLFQQLGLINVPCTIIGHSQGGYLAPFAALHLPSTRRIIGINCEFRHQLLPPTMPFILDSLHGTKDDIVSLDSAREHHQTLIAKGNRGTFHTMPTGHLFDQDTVAHLTTIRAFENGPLP